MSEPDGMGERAHMPCVCCHVHVVGCARGIYSSEWKVAWRFIFFFFFFLCTWGNVQGTWSFLFLTCCDTPCDLLFFCPFDDTFLELQVCCFIFLFNLLDSWCAKRKVCGSRSNLHAGLCTVCTILLLVGRSLNLLCRSVDSLAHFGETFFFAFVTVMLHHFTSVLLAC